MVDSVMLLMTMDDIVVDNEEDSDFGDERMLFVDDVDVEVDDDDNN